MNGWVLVLGVAAPLAGSVFLPFLARLGVRTRNWSALVFTAVSFFCALYSLIGVLSGEPFSVSFDLPLGLGFGLFADALSVFMALAVSFVSIIIILYSFGYIKEYENQNEYYFMVCLFIGAMMGLLYSTNLIMIYVFWEISSFCCWRLIGFYREETAVTRANKTFIVTVFGALLMLIGFLGIYGETGTFDLTDMKGVFVPAWAVALILFGIFSKSATFPLHGWLPDAGVAPSPVTALLHAAVLVKIGVYAYARLFVLTFDADEAAISAVPIIAAVSALIAAGAAFRENDIKRVLAYSTVSQIAFIVLGLSSGEKSGIIGGVLYIAAHAVAKGGLFLCAGIVEHNVGTKDIRKMGGLVRTMPFTAVSFMLCAFSIMGVPPFFGFFSKYLVIDGAVQAGNKWLAAAFILCAVMTVMYLMRLFAKVFLGEQTFPKIKEGTRTMTASVIALGAASLLFGLLSAFPSKLAGMIWG